MYAFKAQYQSREFSGRLTCETLYIVAKDADEAYNKLMLLTKVGVVVYPPVKTGRIL